MLQDFFPFWNELNGLNQKILIQSVYPKTIRLGSIMYSTRKECTGLLLIKKGILRVYMMDDNGKQITLYRLEDGDICLFTASCIMPDITFEVFIESIEDTDTFVIPVEQYQIIIDKIPQVAEYMNRIMASRFSDVMFVLEQIVFHSMDQRIASYLLENSNLDNILKITHEQIANDLGTAREVVSRILKRFEKEQWVELARNQIKIVNLEKFNKILL